MKLPLYRPPATRFQRYVIVRHVWPWSVIRDRYTGKVTWVKDAQALRMTKEVSG